MEDFVSFKLAQRLKEKGFTIPTKSIFGMYNEIGVFHTLTTSADYDICDSGFKCRCYYDYDDFDERDFIAPTISQVLKWLREEKKIHIGIEYSPRKKWRYVVMYMDDRFYNRTTLAVDGFLKFELAALAGIDYSLDNLI